MAGGEVSPVGRTATAPARRGADRAPALRARVVPALRAGLLRRPPPPGRRGARPRRLRRRLHLRGTRATPAGAAPRGRRGADAGRSTGIATRSTRRTATCRRCTPPCPGSSPGTTTRSTTTTRVCGRRRSTPTSRAAAPPPTAPTTSTCRCAGAHARRADGMILRSRHDIGALARFHLLDGRQRRTPQACPLPGRGGGPHDRRALPRADRARSHDAGARAGALARRGPARSARPLAFPRRGDAGGAGRDPQRRSDAGVLGRLGRLPRGAAALAARHRGRRSHTAASSSAATRTRPL